jgi:chromosome segregation ATPase
MKNFLQNLLIFLALCLCALIAIQWVRETDLRKKVQELTNVIHDKSEAILNLEANVRNQRDEIQRLDTQRKQLSETVKSNDLQIANLSKDLEKATNDLQKSERQMQAYKDAYQRTSENLTNANHTITEQNERMKKMAQEANDVVKKFNELNAKYTELAEKWNKQQEDLAKQATNAPVKK